MHEFALAQDIVATIREKVTGDFNQVDSINLEIGTFSGVVIDSLTFGLQVVFESNDFKQGIKINIREIPSIARCKCGKEYQIRDILDRCPVCQSMERRLISGMDILIKSVELKTNLNHKEAANRQ